MRTRIDTRFADSRAADLSLSYGLEPLPALTTLRVVLPAVELELRVLGASHQVVVGPGAATWPPSSISLWPSSWSETVACLPDRLGTLPDHEEAVIDGLRVRFAARCHRRLTAGELAAKVAGIVRDSENDDRVLVGEFPGVPYGVTALRAWPESGGAAWRTWHAYPQAGELVETLSAVRPA
ncbi:MAG: DUF2617 family protein [Actinophytocola sp.]|uniref:DUF2617 family protein n=1 Tax=Actinophytocola sp. TaxID=1872138 RepID=UPI001325FECA|nr:DUF2617 family protein [Actinophytocola sp.]MPZ80312.1 DUF2617 family protein [Actinophytocola sp.]